MPKHGGPRRGAGRPEGSPNKATIAKLVEAEKRVEQAKQRGEKLAVEVLRDFMKAFADQAAYHQPIPDGVPIPPGRKPDAERFTHYGKLAVETATSLAQYESPRLRAIMVSSTPPPNQAQPPATLDLIANENNPGNLYRVWQQKIGGQRRVLSAPR